MYKSRRGQAWYGLSASVGMRQDVSSAVFSVFRLIGSALSSFLQMGDDEAGGA